MAGGGSAAAAGGGGGAASSSSSGAAASSGSASSSTTASSGGGSAHAASGKSASAGSGSGAGHAASGKAAAGASASGKAAGAAKVHLVPDPLFGTQIHYPHVMMPQFLGGGALTGKTILSAAFVGAVAGAAVGIGLGVVATFVIRRCVCDCGKAICNNCGWCKCDPGDPHTDPTCGGRCREARCQGHSRTDCPESDGCIQGAKYGAICGCCAAASLGACSHAGIHTCWGIPLPEDSLAHQQQCLNGFGAGALGGGLGCCCALQTQEVRDKDDPDGKVDNYWWF
eukprot:Hpha_TRINITY_DN12828_c0_g1::TRINITY_DN12828_c0_g1_i1::g.24189::m.24189